MLASFSKKAKDGEVQAVRAWLASHGGAAAVVASVPSPSAPANPDGALRPDPAAQPAGDAASAAITAVAAALPAAPPASSSALAASAPETAASATPYSATPPPDR
jgi:hypothetical protein